MSEILLSQEEVEVILRNRFNDSQAKYISFKISPISKSNIGFMGRYHILEITYAAQNQINTETFFIKSQLIIKQRAEMAKERNVFLKEVFFYVFLLKEFTKYGYDTSFAPKCFYCKDNQLLVLENLVNRNLKLLKKFQLYDLDECKAGLHTLALFHGASLLYEEEMTRQCGRMFRLGDEYPNIFEENFFTHHQKDSSGFVILNHFLGTIKRIIDLLPHDDKYKEEFKRRLKLADLLNIFIEHSSGSASRLRKTCGHGDLWFNNVFFGYGNFKAVECCLVDFQIMRYFHPTFDVLMFLYLNTNREFRKKHLTALLQYYYDHLSEVMRNHGVSSAMIFPLTDYQSSLRLVQCAAMFAVMVCNSLVLMPQELITEFINRHDDNTIDSNFHTKITMQAFDTDQHFRNVLIENFQDLHESIFNCDNMVM